MRKHLRHSGGARKVNTSIIGSISGILADWPSLAGVRKKLDGAFMSEHCC
jgi:hypothetical protein